MTSVNPAEELDSQRICSTSNRSLLVWSICLFLISLLRTSFVSRSLSDLRFVPNFPRIFLPQVVLLLLSECGPYGGGRISFRLFPVYKKGRASGST